jgi:MFS family permease
MTSLVYIGILIHGVIFGFFIVGGQVYVGKTAPAEIQGQAQGLYALMAFGIGSFIGTFANNELINHFTDPVKRLVEGKEVNLLEGSWDKVWLVTLVCAVICLVVMTIFFNPKKEEQK